MVSPMVGGRTQASVCGPGTPHKERRTSQPNAAYDCTRCEKAWAGRGASGAWGREGVQQGCSPRGAAAGPGSYTLHTDHTHDELQTGRTPKNAPIRC